MLKPPWVPTVAEIELSYSALSNKRTNEAANAVFTRRLIGAESASCSLSVAPRRRSRPVQRPLYGTERKLVTILFADVMGSMALSRSIEPEEWWLVIAHLFEDMCEGVSRFGGRLGSFTGDGVMAVFEGHGRPEDDAHSACEAALWLRDAMHRLADALQRERGLDLSVRIGVNSGEVLAGTIGHNDSRLYTVSGYAVALAKRIEALTQPGHVCVSEHTAQYVARANCLRDRGLFHVKGAPAKVRVFELIGRTDRRGM